MTFQEFLESAVLAENNTDGLPFRVPGFFKILRDGDPDFSSGVSTESGELISGCELLTLDFDINYSLTDDGSLVSPDSAQAAVDTPVPESSTLTLLGIGTVSILGYHWRRMRKLPARRNPVMKAQT